MAAPRVHFYRSDVLMAVEFDGITIPESTGAVETPGPVTTEQVPGHPVSSGAVDGPPESTTHKFGALGQESTGAFPTPGPETSGPFAKVVRPGRRAAEPATTTAQTKAQQPAQTSGDVLPGASGH